MNALIEIFFFIFIFPIALIAISMNHIFKLIKSIFNPALLFFGIWLGSFGAFLFPSRLPDNKPFVSLVGAIAQSQVAGFSTPLIFLAVAGLLICLSLFVGLSKTTY